MCVAVNERALRGSTFDGHNCARQRLLFPYRLPCESGKGGRQRVPLIPSVCVSSVCAGTKQALADGLFSFFLFFLDALG